MKNTTPIAFDKSFVPIQVVSCPRCGSNYLHQVNAHVFWREEDAKTGISVFSSDFNELNISKNMEGNPSARRNGISIQFICEQCSCEDTTPLKLNIVQHKGNTYIAWE